MKVRCIDGSWSSNELTTGKEYEVLSEVGCYYQLKINNKGIRYHCYLKSRFEVIKSDNKTEELSDDERDFVQEIIDECLKEKNKMEKTFREVIADIKEGEVWETCNGDKLSKIKRIKDSIHFDFIESGNGVSIRNDSVGARYKLQRKEYTFEEAYKEYKKEGIIIESCVNGDQFKRVNGIDCYKTEHINFWHEVNSDSYFFKINQMNGKWYINN